MEKCRVLVIEDDDVQRELLKEILQDSGFRVSVAPTAEKGLQSLLKDSVDVVVTDVRLPGMDGLSFLRKVKRDYPDVEVIVITAFSNVEDAVNAIKEGAFHYVTKPFDPQVLINLIDKACQLARLKKVPKRDGEIVYASKEMEDILKKASLFARAEAPVLILGESGVGKELIARFIHRESGRKGKFVAVNCAAIPRDLFESELFGYEKGAFTGALKAKKGLFEEADGGTLFLDEIGELPLELQPKLLRVLQEGKVRRVGATLEREVDVKIVAATNRDLRELVEKGEFREDLYYRLNVLTLKIPPLRERPEDILELTGFFLKKYSDKYGKKVEITPEALQKLLSYSFPGNVRELENLLHRLVIFSEGKITERDLEELSESKPCNELDFSKPLPEKVAEFEKRLIEEALKRTNYVQTRAAKLLGIDEKSLRYKRKKYGI
ncbi:sigma-54-dependent transcriptional regulator [Phorcysia thermohydrogeniphila]|uniref:Two-component system NtrC family response regulator n=1 Tax=Phorcysia thermohydrogeniphila TaxID=936138 RepID=A0A4R1GDW3_9BACT|nr:sigma-54 dependent transcriptional regulator [Phorcysia thermohydrogeniphila]TCK06314.1 two-component system NtrC family response regulator [Phorcysia thermohydrogeniphila]